MLEVHKAVHNVWYSFRLNGSLVAVQVMLHWSGVLVCSRGMYVCWCLWFGCCRAVVGVVRGSRVSDTVADPWEKMCDREKKSLPKQFVLLRF